MPSVGPNVPSYHSPSRSLVLRGGRQAAVGAATSGALGWIALVGWIAVVAGLGWATGCKPKASQAECDELLGRYAALVVIEKFPDASAGQIATEEQREKVEARGDDAFKNCSSEVSRAEFECAMHAATADALEKCVE